MNKPFHFRDNLTIIYFTISNISNFIFQKNHYRLQDVRISIYLCFFFLSGWVKIFEITFFCLFQHFKMII